MTAMCGVQLKDIKRAKEFILMMGLNETIHQWLSQCCLYDHVLRKDGHIRKRALDFEVEIQRKKMRLKMA